LPLTFDEAWRDHRRDVEHVARRVSRGAGGPGALGDLVAAGMVGLWEAWRRYDPARSRFWPFAERRVRGAMVDELRRLDHLPREMRRAVSGGEHPGCVLAFPVDVAGLTWLLPSGSDPEEELAASEESEHLSRVVDEAVSSLPRRLEVVVRSTYLGDRSLAVAASELGVTESRVCQMRSEAAEILRKELSVVYCETCRKARLDGPERCPGCGRRMRHLRMGETEPSQLSEDGPEVDPDEPAAAPTRAGARQWRRKITHDGRSLTVSEWAEVTGLARNTIYSRLKRGMSADDVLRSHTPQKR
jgi:RNA polymerase sigma factor for flagellar operon FliA